MPHLETWNKLPPAIRQHLMDRLRKAVSSRRAAAIACSADLQVSIFLLPPIWVESHPLVPECEWVAQTCSGGLRFVPN